MKAGHFDPEDMGCIQNMRTSQCLVVMGIPALLGEPDHLARLTKKSRLFRLPNGSSVYHILYLL